MFIVVTGGIGSGKSTIIKMLKSRLGDSIYYASYDSIVRELYAHDATFQNMLIREFGTCNRKEISNIVFFDKKKMKKLNELAGEYVANQLCFFPQPCLVEIPLYFEIKDAFDHEITPPADIVITVTCPIEIRKQRVIARDKMSEEKFDSIVATQATDERRDEGSTVIIRSDLVETVDDLAHVLDLIYEVEIRAIANQVLLSSERIDQLIEAYREPHRHYHNLEHLYKVLMNLSLIRAVHFPKNTGYLAALYHDFVYSTDPSDYHLNEEKSAQACLDAAFETLGGDPVGMDHARMAATIIRDTKTHTNSTGVPTANYVHDADMMILASEEDELFRYDDNIALEFGVNESNIKQFAPLRIKALRKMNEVPVFSGHLVELNDKAKSNIEKLIARWEEKLK